MVGNLAVDYFFTGGSGRYNIGENLVHIATTIGKLQHLEYLKSAFLDTYKWAITLVFPETVTYSISQPISYISGTLVMQGKPDALYLAVMPNSNQCQGF